ncbi:GHKL domain-containing protein [Sphaerochaeta sp.]|uniref:GHKL domain-containing protein n=1 Tax=Sphaerochaeta sp. TaxID=1972642 RepID=UPI003D09EA9E
MREHFPDLLRAVVSDVMLILLLWTMAMPKYKNKAVYIVATSVILIGNVCINYYFYRSQDYTSVFYVDLAMLLVIGIVMKPLFTDTIMQWCFSYITMLNIHAAIVFVSYTLSRLLPDPKYGHIFLRLILFSIVIFVFRKWVSKPYRKVLDYWHIYIVPVVLLFACFMGYFFGGDIKHTLINNYIQLFLLILLGFSVYVTIIHSLKTITTQYEMREENLSIQAEREFLQLAADGMSERLKLMEEVSAQNSRTAHDRRHFNNVLLELLEHGHTGEATALLQKQNQISTKMNRVYCENHAVNAAVSHYAGIAEQSGIRTEIMLDIPAVLEVDALELSMVVSNLIENAINACAKLTDNKVPYIRFTCRSAGRLLMEMENPCDDNIKLDENACPVSTGEGHGIGSKSVAAFAKKYDGELLYKIENGVFRVRLLI